ncbi:MAG: CoA transferase, partial [Actinomycetota bacterium]|nr:CoA transferase [Actinomycetota bacterium]
LLNARESGEGQVVDAAMVDGSALLMASHHGFAAEGWWDGTARSSNLLDGAAPFYTTYEASDGGRVAVGALEPQFFAELVGKLGLDPAELPAQLDREGWPTMREAFASRFSERTRDEWSEHFEGSDACVAPVLSMSEAPDHRYNRARSTFTELEGIVQPAPAPRFSATPASVEGTPCSPGEHTDRILADLGYSPERIVMLRGSGAIS